MKWIGVRFEARLVVAVLVLAVTKSLESKRQHSERCQDKGDVVVSRLVGGQDAILSRPVWRKPLLSPPQNQTGQQGDRVPSRSGDQFQICFLLQHGPELIVAKRGQEVRCISILHSKDAKDAVEIRIFACWRCQELGTLGQVLGHTHQQARQVPCDANAVQVF
jgi:hypothetical protein